MLSEDIVLLTETIERDSYGQEIVTYTETPVQAEKKSVTRSEFYQAATSDLKPEVVFDVHTFEYFGEKLLRWNGVIYSIIRAYDHDRSGLKLTELVCERRVGHG